MKKLRLQIEQLAVESFVTAQAAGPRGTVRAHATEFGDTCDPAPSCGPETCGNADCIRQTDNLNLCGGGGGSVGCTMNGCPSGTVLLSCAGCTTYDYTVNANHDTCGYCLSRESESPDRCRCI